MYLSFIISIIGLILLLINCILFISKSKNKDALHLTLTIYLSILFIVELLCNIIGILKPNSNFFLSHYYFNIQFIVLSLFFYQLYKKTILKLIILINLIVVSLFIGNQYYNNPALYWKFNNIEIGITSSLLLIYALIHFYNNLKESHIYFYFCYGLTFYLISSALIFLSGNTELIIFTEPFFIDIWVFNSLFYILYQVLIYKEWRFINKYS